MATTTTLGTGFDALTNQYLPGTSNSSWSALSADVAPTPATGFLAASSNDGAYEADFFDFPSAAAATAFYSSPPGELEGTAGVLGYSPLTGSPGVPAPSQGLDLRTCTGEGSGPSLTPAGNCSNGGASYSVGVGTIIQRSSVVIFILWLSGNNVPQGSSADLSKVTPYANDALSLLSKVGLPS